MATRKKTPARKATTRRKAGNPIRIAMPPRIAAQLRAIVEQALRAATTATIESAPTGALTPPRIGQYWKGQGGVYAGIRRAVVNGVETFYHLIDGPISDTNMTFDAAGKFIAAQRVDGHADFVRPNEGDGRLIDANLDRKDINGLFWLTQHADLSDCAWFQDFDNGHQDYNGKDDSLRVRAVRRLVIR